MDDTIRVSDEDMREVARLARELANREFEPWECGYVGGLWDRDPDGDVGMLEAELGRPLRGDEVRAYRQGYRCGAADRVRAEEGRADAGPPDRAGVPL